jgi:hypothetical protein
MGSSPSARATWVGPGESGRGLTARAHAVGRAVAGEGTILTGEGRGSARECMGEWGATLTGWSHGAERERAAIKRGTAPTG